MNASDFRVGRRYQNRLGFYEVIDIKSTELVIRYEDGQETRVDASTAAKIHTKIENEYISRLPEGLSAGNHPNFFWTIGVIARFGDLQAEIPPKSLSSFWRKYSEAAGLSSRDPISGIFLLEKDATKWGPELRIYLPVSVTASSRFILPRGVSLVSSTAKDSVRINKNSFWWSLVRDMNFRLGNCQDLKAIEQAIPSQFRDHYRSGISYI